MNSVHSIKRVWILSLIVIHFSRVLVSGSGQGKYNSSISKLLLSEFMMTPPTAHSSSRHAGDFFNSGHLSPEKRKPDAISNQQSLPPLPAHQQHVSTNSIPRSSPNSMYRYSVTE